MILSQLEKRFTGDHPRTVAVREHIAKACAEFVELGLADPKFNSEFANDSDQKLDLFVCFGLANSTGGCNGLVKSLGWRFVV